MAKVKCSVCANEISGFCKVKNVKVSINKKRKCEAYIYDESKLKTKKEIPTTRLNYTEQEARRKTLRRELKQMREIIDKREKSPIIQPKDSNFYLDNKHPITGDLSRFRSTATGDR